VGFPCRILLKARPLPVPPFGGMLQQGLVICTRGGWVVLVEGVVGKEGLGGSGRGVSGIQVEGMHCMDWVVEEAI
jgi:hypothetical protein